MRLHIYFVSQTMVKFSCRKSATFTHFEQMVYKKLALRNKSLKQLSELDYLARSNNKKSVEGCYCNITREKSVIVSYFYSVLYAS